MIDTRRIHAWYFYAAYISAASILFDQCRRKPAALS